MNKHAMKYSIIYDGNEATSVTVYWRGRAFEATPTHPNFRLVVMALEQKRPAIEVLELFDTGSALARGFERARELVKQVANEAITRVQSRKAPDEASTVTDLAKRALSAESVDAPPAAPTVVHTETTEGDNLDELNQRQLQTLAHQLGVPGVVGKTNAWLKDQIREARAHNLVDVSAKVEVIDGRLYFGGEEMNGALADAIIAYHRQGHLDFTPLVRFMAKLMENPNPHSREHLYQWMAHLSFSITDEGDLLAYKGVRRTTTRNGDPEFASWHSTGTAKVNGVLHENMAIPNPIGGVVEMPRNQVTFDPRSGCSTGLHIGTVSFATGFGNAMIEVKVDPRDVVSVPTENEWQKLRVCKYTVMRECTPEEARQLRSAVPAMA